MLYRLYSLDSGSTGVLAISCPCLLKALWKPLQILLQVRMTYRLGYNSGGSQGSGDERLAVQEAHYRAHELLKTTCSISKRICSRVGQRNPLKQRVYINKVAEQETWAAVFKEAAEHMHAINVGNSFASRHSNHALQAGWLKRGLSLVLH